MSKDSNNLHVWIGMCNTMELSNCSTKPIMMKWARQVWINYCRKQALSKTGQEKMLEIVRL